MAWREGPPPALLVWWLLEEVQLLSSPCPSGTAMSSLACKDTLQVERRSQRFSSNCGGCHSNVMSIMMSCMLQGASSLMLWAVLMYCRSTLFSSI